MTETDNKTEPTVVAFSSYKGTPTVVFSNGTADRFPFSFGPAKARKLLSYIEQNGAEAFTNALKQIANKAE